MTPDELTALRAPEGRLLLDQAGQYDESTALAAATRLRAAGHDRALVAAALTQARLRARAALRLGDDAERWWFTPDGVEQATRPEVASRRAARLAAAGVHSVVDLGCGIGADTIAFARAGLTVLAVDRDPLTAAIAEANAEEAGVADRVTVRCADVADVAVSAVGAAFVDPARRAAGRRLTDPESWSPPWSFVTRLAETMPTVAKVAPGIDHTLPPKSAETEWISVGGALVEACVWFRPLAEDSVRRRAVLLPTSDQLDDRGLSTPPTGPLGAYLVEPADAIVRSGLVAIVAAELDGRLLDPRIAYVTTDDRPPTSARYRSYAVLDSLPFSLKPLRARLRSLGAGDITVKKRGVAIDPAELRRRLRPNPAAGAAVTVLITRIGSAPVAVIARPL